MEAMKPLRVFSAILAALLLSTLLIAGDNREATIKFVVLKDDNGKPVRNAAVILHPVSANGKQGKKGGFEIKTNSEGQAETDGIPYGLIRVQVIAPGFQTFGQDYTINQPEQPVTIRLKRPRDQYSIYPEQH
jgi:hypothetical protein